MSRRFVHCSDSDTSMPDSAERKPVGAPVNEDHLNAFHGDLGGMNRERVLATADNKDFYFRRAGGAGRPVSATQRTQQHAGRGNEQLNAWHNFHTMSEDRDPDADVQADLHGGQLHRLNRMARAESAGGTFRFSNEPGFVPSNAPRSSSNFARPSVTRQVNGGYGLHNARVTNGPPGANAPHGPIGAPPTSGPSLGSHEVQRAMTAANPSYVEQMAIARALAADFNKGRNAGGGNRGGGNRGGGRGNIGPISPGPRSRMGVNNAGVRGGRGGGSSLNPHADIHTGRGTAATARNGTKTLGNNTVKASNGRAAQGSRSTVKQVSGGMQASSTFDAGRKQPAVSFNLASPADFMATVQKPKAGLAGSKYATDMVVKKESDSEQSKEGVQPKGIRGSKYANTE